MTCGKRIVYGYDILQTKWDSTLKIEIEAICKLELLNPSRPPSPVPGR